MPIGRPRKTIDPNKVAEIIGELGGTDAKLAVALGIKPNSLDVWKKRNPELVKTLNQRKLVADQAVEKSLYQRALGYSHKSEKIFLSKDGEIVRAETVEHYPPDPTSCIFWLKNRQQEEWRERREPDINQTNVQINGAARDLVTSIRAFAKKQIAAKRTKTAQVVDVEAKKIS